MEFKKLNLRSQVLFLGRIPKNNGQSNSDSNSNEQNNTANKTTDIDINNSYYYYFSYDDQINKKLDIFEILYEKNVIPIKNIIYSIKYKEEFNDINIHLIAKGNLNNKIYLLFISNDLSHVYGGILDLIIKQYFSFILETEENKTKIKDIIKQIPQKDYITILEQNRLFFFCGLIGENLNQNDTIISNEENEKTDYSVDHEKINKSCFYFDLETLEFAKQKFPEFSIIPRFQGAGASQNGMIYLLGGYSSLSNREENICSYVQFGKYFDEKLNKFNVAKIERESPINMINNDLLIIQNRYLISFSAHKYQKIWIMDTQTNQGVNINLKEKLDLVEYNKRDLLFVLIDCEIIEENEGSNVDGQNNEKKNVNLLIVRIEYEDNKNEIKFSFIDKSFNL